MGCPPISIVVTESELADLRDTALLCGLDLGRDSGTIYHATPFGDVTVEYEITVGVLTMQCTEMGHGVTCGDVNAHLAGIIDAALGADR